MAEPKRRNGPISEADMDTFLGLIEAGHSRPDAARQLGRTGSDFRSLSKVDPGFDNAYQEACAIGKETLGDGIMVEYRRRALDPESKSDTLLHNLATVYVDDFAMFRRQRVEMTGADGGPIEQVNHDGATDRLVAKLAPVVDIDSARPSANGHRNGDGAARQP